MDSLPENTLLGGSQKWFGGSAKRATGTRPSEQRGTGSTQTLRREEAQQTVLQEAQQKSTTNTYGPDTQ
eukprot:2226267-Rhodomonas_salina.1